MNAASQPGPPCPGDDRPVSTGRAAAAARLILRWGLCAAAVGWLAHTVAWSDLKRVWMTADRPLLVLGVLAFGPAPVLIAVRLQWVLAVHEIRLSLWDAIRATFAGNFVINALPVGTTGGDTVKAFYIARGTPRKHEAVTCIFLDRAIGVLGLLLLAGTTSLVHWRHPTFAGVGRLVALAVSLLLAGMGVYFSDRVRRFLRLEQLLARLPLGRHIERVDRAVLAFRGRWWRLTACLLLSVLLQLICIVSIFLAGRGLGVGEGRVLADAWVYLACTPLCLLAGALPIGGMELSYVGLFYGVAGLGTEAAAVSLSLFSRVIQMVWSLPGGLVVLQGGLGEAGARGLPPDDRPAPGT